MSQNIPLVELYRLSSSSSYLSNKQIISVLELTDEATSELSTWNWKSEKTMIDELVSFLPVSRAAIGEEGWEAVAQMLLAVCEKGRVIILRGIEPENKEAVIKFVEQAKNSIVKDLDERVVVVLVGWNEENVIGKDGKYPVKELAGIKKILMTQHEKEKNNNKQINKKRVTQKK